MPDPRVHIPEPLAPGARLRLGEDRARHLTTVLRLAPGAKLRAFNAEDGEWRARIAAADKRGLDIEIESLLRAPHTPPDLDLLFAPVKRHATDLIVEKATELGVRRIRPIITQRTITDIVRTDRLSLIAREAAEQTERFDLPEILDPLPLSKALDGWDQDRLLIYADEHGGAQTIAATLSSPVYGGGVERSETEGASPPQKIALLTGPEGGFDQTERQWLRSLPFVRSITLGPRILRAETAAIAALALIQSAWGDWRAQPPAD